MGSESDGISLGVGLIIVVLVISLALTVFRVGRDMIQQSSDDVNKIINGASNSNYSRFNNATVHGYDIWDLFHQESGKRINGGYFMIRVKTGTADIHWTADRPISGAISDDKSADNYLPEDASYLCSLIYSAGNNGDIIGVNAELVME